MSEGSKKVVTVGSRLASYIGSKAGRDKKLQAAAMQAEFTLKDTLIILCYLSKDPDPEISSHARKNLIPAARSWYSRPDRPDLPEPIHEIVMKVIEKIGPGEKTNSQFDDEFVQGNIGLLGLGEMIQAIDHNNRTVTITLTNNGNTAKVFSETGKIVGAVCGDDDGMPALYKAFAWGDASFTYYHSPPGAFENRIKVNTLNLVIDALEHAPDEDPFNSELSKDWSVHGNLKVMNIFELAEIFEMNSKQTVCLLQTDEDTGHLYFKDGRIVNASLKEMTGMDAACHLLAWPNAKFTIKRGGEQIPEVIHVGMQNLIIEAMRLLDEGVTVTERIATELALINELFEGQDIFSLPVLEKVRLVFSDDQHARESLETDRNPLVKKAIKVKISKTVHKYLSPLTEHETRIQAAKGLVPLSTSEKLVLLSYLSHDDSTEIRELAKSTLEKLDVTTLRKGFGADLHPSVMDFLIRETIKDESLIKVASASESILEDTALFILETWQSEEIQSAILENRKLIERSSAVSEKLAQISKNPELIRKINSIEDAMLQGQTEVKIEGPLNFFGLGGLIRGARQGMRSGTVVVETPGKTGRVYFKNGRVSGSVWGDEIGVRALEGIVRSESPQFRYVLRTFFHEDNIEGSTADDILESADAQPKALPADTSGVRFITGSLKAIDLFELLSGLEGTHVPISITVVAEEGTGQVFRDRSRILHAHVDGKEGPYNAMAAMVSWTGIRFILRHADYDFPVTVDKPLVEFFTESLKLIPEEMGRQAKPGELPEWELSEAEYESLYFQIAQMGVAEKIKLALMGNKEARNILVRDSNKLVAVAVVKSPKIMESEIEAITRSRHVCDEVLRHIAATKEWMRSYNIKLNLAGNSKTPLPIAMRLLPQLMEHDLRRLAKSKNVSAILATQARRLVDTKRG